MTTLSTMNFHQLNLVAVVNRADAILKAVEMLTMSVKEQSDILVSMLERVEAGDDWERTSLQLAALELLQRCIRLDDPSVESMPDDWNGGFEIVEPETNVKHASSRATHLVNIDGLPDKMRRILVDSLYVTVPSTNNFEKAISTLKVTQQCDILDLWLRAINPSALSIPYVVEGIYEIQAATLP